MPRIAIVGAGIAGLTAALTLQDAGLSCDIYEASRRVGGRMHSDATTWQAGQVSEWCGEFIDGDHTTILQLIARFGLQTTLRDQGQGSRQPSFIYLLGRYYRPEELSRDVEALAPIALQQLRDVGFPTTYAQSTSEGQRLDQMNVSAWIERYVPGGRAVPLGRFLERACSGLFGLDARQLSALNLLYVLRTLFGSQIDVSEQAPDAAASHPQEGTRAIVGGNARLPEMIARSLPEGRIHLDHRLAAIERTRSHEVMMTFATSEGITQVAYDDVILALPFSTLRHVDYRRAGFDARKTMAIEQLGYGAISKLFLQFDQRYWDNEGPWPRSSNGFFFTDLEIQTVWDASRGQPGQQGLLVNYTSGRQGAAYSPPAAYTTSADSAVIQGYAQNCLQQLETIFPGISAHYTGQAALSYPTGDPNLLGSYSCWRVGQYTQFAGYERVRQGRVFFAGEHCSVEFQGYMEGAAREGVRAARELAQDMS